MDHQSPDDQTTNAQVVRMSDMNFARIREYADGAQVVNTDPRFAAALINAARDDAAFSPALLKVDDGEQGVSEAVKRAAGIADRWLREGRK